MPSPFQRHYFDLATEQSEALNDYCRINKKVKKDLLAELVAAFIESTKATPAPKKQKGSANA